MVNDNNKKTETSTRLDTAVIKYSEESPFIQYSNTLSQFESEYNNPQQETFVSLYNSLLSCHREINSHTSLVKDPEDLKNFNNAIHRIKELYQTRRLSQTLIDGFYAINTFFTEKGLYRTGTMRELTFTNMLKVERVFLTYHLLKFEAKFEGATLEGWYNKWLEEKMKDEAISDESKALLLEAGRGWVEYAYNTLAAKFVPVSVIQSYWTTNKDVVWEDFMNFHRSQSDESVPLIFRIEKMRNFHKLWSSFDDKSSVLELLNAVDVAEKALSEIKDDGDTSELDRVMRLFQSLYLSALSLIMRRRITAAKITI